MTVARLYEEMKSKADAIKTLHFLIREYPKTPFKDAAEKDLARLNGAKIQGTVAVDNIRFFNEQNSVRIVVDLGGEVSFAQGQAKNPDRAFVDISGAKLNLMLIGKLWRVDSPLLQQIRVGQYDATTVRVVLDIGNIGRVNSFSLREPDRLIIDVLGKESITQTGPVSPAPSPVLTVAATTPSPKATAPQPPQPSVEPTVIAAKVTPTPPPGSEKGGRGRREGDYSGKNHERRKAIACPKSWIEAQQGCYRRRARRT
jgi:hypothetical protein